MTYMHIPAIAAALLFSAETAIAQSGLDPAVEADLAVTDWVDHVLGDGFDAPHRNMLKSVAHQMAVAGVCPGFNVDQDKAGAALAKVAEGHSEDDEDFEAVQAALLMSLGAYIGFGRAAHAMDPDGFCAHAEEERTGEEAPHLIYASN